MPVKNCLSRGLGQIGGLGRSKGLAQCRLVDLSSRVPRQGVDEFDQMRPLEARQIGFAMRTNVRL